MKVLIDENMSSRRLAIWLQSAGHDVLLATDAGLVSVNDARVLALAVSRDRLVITRDQKDFTDLHDLVVAVGGHHTGIPVVLFDKDPRHNLSERGIVTATSKLESSGVVLADHIHVLNQWR